MTCVSSLLVWTGSAVRSATHPILWFLGISSPFSLPLPHYMSFRPSQFCSCGVPSVHGLSGPAGLPLLRVSSSQFSVVECGVFVGCQCSHICVLPCTLCPLFCCCLYILYVIASLCICNCLCLCTFFLCFSTLYQPTCVFVYPFTCCCMYILYVNFSVPASVWVPVFVPSTTLHVFVCTPSQMVTLCLFWCPVNTRTLDDCRFSFPWVQVSVSQTTEYCLYCGLLPCTHSSALCLGHALGEPFLHALL